MERWGLLLIAAVAFVVVRSELLAPIKRCIPTSISRGPCHTCVCTTNGVYHCKPDKCDVNMTNNGNRRRFYPTYPTIKDKEMCIPGKKYKQDCNTCECISGNTLICTKMHCLNKKEIQKLMHLDLIPQRSSLPELPKENCVPGNIYLSSKRSRQKCFCDHEMNAVCVTPKQSSRSDSTSKELIPKLTDKEFEKLPALPYSSSECKAGMTYRVLCNICLCLSSGNTMCETKMCYSPDDVNRIAAHGRTGKPCTPGDDAKIECVDCKCAKDVWKCDPIPGCFPLTLRRQLHKPKEPKPKNKLREKGEVQQESKQVTHGPEQVPYEPEQNGESAIGSMTRLSLNLGYEKCIPKMVYKLDCNNCYCQDDSSLRCTKKGCLNHVQSEMLNRQRKEYEETHDPPKKCNE